MTDSRISENTEDIRKLYEKCGDLRVSIAEILINIENIEKKIDSLSLEVKKSMPGQKRGPSILLKNAPLIWTIIWTMIASGTIEAILVHFSNKF